MKYIVPVIVSQKFSFSMPAICQYILDGQQLSVINGENFCGSANDNNAFEVCLSGSQDISAQLAGLTINSSVSGPGTILSCTASSDADCSGLLYQCLTTTDVFGGPQCITSISDGNETVSCPSNACSF